MHRAVAVDDPNPFIRDKQGRTDPLEMKKIY